MTARTQYPGADDNRPNGGNLVHWFDLLDIYEPDETATFGLTAGRVMDADGNGLYARNVAAIEVLARVEALRREAIEAGDNRLALICAEALGTE